MMRLFKDPLLHFLAIGLVLFAVYRVATPQADGLANPKTLVVDEKALLTFMQYRARAFEPETAKARLQNLSADQLKHLINAYVREQVLYREALSLGLDSNDYIIKRRLIQKLDFISQGFAEAAVKLSDKEIEAHYTANKREYYVQPSVTFTHVFFDANKRGTKKAAALAKSRLVELNSKAAPFTDAPSHGDRFPYHVNYVERSPDYVTSHFGPDLTKAVFTIDPGPDVWHGPYSSPHGNHVVMLAKRQEGRIPALDEIRGRVREDARRARQKELADAAITAIIDGYDVRVTYVRERGQ